MPAAEKGGKTARQLAIVMMRFSLAIIDQLGSGTIRAAAPIGHFRATISPLYGTVPCLCHEASAAHGDVPSRSRQFQGLGF